MLSQINIQDIVAIAKDAGVAIMQTYSQYFKIEYKNDKSPLTEADKKSNKIIIKALTKLPTNLPIISEEGASVDFNKRRNWKYFWLIDPLDGTKEFIKKNNEFTVNIALIHNKTPVLGVVYAPALNVTYWAKQGCGAFKEGEKLPLPTNKTRTTYKIIASRSHMSQDTENFINAIKTDRKKQLLSMGSSLKICLVAEGAADIYPRLAPTMEWDSAAAHAIIIESGKKIIQFHNNRPLIYNKENLLNPWFIVS